MNRTSTLKRRTPLRSNRPIRRQSSRQRRREDALRSGKLARVLSMFTLSDSAWCEHCGRRFGTVENAMMGLAWHHKTFRSQGGSDDGENLQLLCQVGPTWCHQRIGHNLSIADDAYWEAVRLDAAGHEAWEAMGEDEGGFDE